MDGNTFYLQGRTLLNEKKFQDSVFSFLKSALFFKKCNRTDRILPILNNIKRALNNCEKEKITQLDDVIAEKFDNKDFEDMLNEIESNITSDSLILVRTNELKKTYLDKKNYA